MGIRKSVCNAKMSNSNKGLRHLSYINTTDWIYFIPQKEILLLFIVNKENKGFFPLFTP